MYDCGARRHKLNLRSELNFSRINSTNTSQREFASRFLPKHALVFCGGCPFSPVLLSNLEYNDRTKRSNPIPTDPELISDKETVSDAQHSGQIVPVRPPHTFTMVSTVYHHSHFTSSLEIITFSCFFLVMLLLKIFSIKVQIS